MPKNVQRPPPVGGQQQGDGSDTPSPQREGSSEQDSPPTQRETTLCGGFPDLAF